MLVLSQAQVKVLLDVDALIDALASAMADLSAGRASAPDRIGVRVPGNGGMLAAMPGYVPSAGVLMSKLVSLYQGNAGGVLPTDQAVIVVFDPGTASRWHCSMVLPSPQSARAPARRCRRGCSPAAMPM